MEVVEKDKLTIPDKAAAAGSVDGFPSAEALRDSTGTEVPVSSPTPSAPSSVPAWFPLKFGTTGKTKIKALNNMVSATLIQAL